MIAFVLKIRPVDYYHSDGILRIRASTVNIGTLTPLDRSCRRHAQRASRRIAPLPGNAGKGSCRGELRGDSWAAWARRAAEGEDGGVVQKLRYFGNNREFGEFRGGRRMPVPNGEWEGTRLGEAAGMDQVRSGQVRSGQVYYSAEI